MKCGLYQRYVYQLASQYIKNDDRVIDIGCGNGFTTSILRRFSDYVIGGDLDNRINPEYNIDFRKLYVNNYGARNEFDVVTSFDVIEHIADDYGYLKELIRIIKPKGYIIIGTPNRNRLSNKITSLFRKIKYPRNLGYHRESGGNIIHLREYTAEDLKKLASRFDNIQIIAIKHSFLGIYTSIGAVGLRGIDINILKQYCQHLFMVIQKR